MRQGAKKHKVKQMLMLMSLSPGYHLRGGLGGGARVPEEMQMKVR